MKREQGYLSLIDVSFLICVSRTNNLLSTYLATIFLVTKCAFVTCYFSVMYSVIIVSTSCVPKCALHELNMMPLGPCHTKSFSTIRTKLESARCTVHISSDTHSVVASWISSRCDMALCSVHTFTQSRLIGPEPSKATFAELSGMWQLRCLSIRC